MSSLERAKLLIQIHTIRPTEAAIKKKKQCVWNEEKTSFSIRIWSADKNSHSSDVFTHSPHLPDIVLLDYPVLTEFS